MGGTGNWPVLAFLMGAPQVSIRRQSLQLVREEQLKQLFLLQTFKACSRDSVLCPVTGVLSVAMLEE